MKKSFLILVAALGCNALAAQTSDPVIIPNAGTPPAKITTDTTSQQSLGSNTLEVVTPSGIELITPSGTVTIPATVCPPINNNQPSTAPVTPDSNKKNTEGINNATPNLSLPQNPTQ